MTTSSIEPWLPNMIRRADAMLVVVDLTDAPLDQMTAITAQLENKGIAMGQHGVKALIVANKIDAGNAMHNFQALQHHYQGRLPVIAISAKERISLEELKRKIYETLDVIRVYTKSPGEKADLTDPIVLDRGSTLQDAAAAVHKDFARKLKFARIWGSGKHDGVMAKRDHILQDGDVVELHL